MGRFSRLKQRDEERIIAEASRRVRLPKSVGGGGGGSSAPTPKASSTVSGTVKTDIDQVDPLVYTADSVDDLLVDAAADVAANYSPIVHTHDAADVVSGTFGTSRYAANSVTEAKIGLSDNTTDNVSSSAHGFAPKSPADATKFLNGAATPDYAQVKDSDLDIADVTDNDVSPAAHGFAPKGDGDPTKFLNAAAGYSHPDASAGGVPAGGSTGQVLTKLSGSDFDDDWKTPGDAASTIVQNTAPVQVHTGNTFSFSSAPTNGNVLLAFIGSIQQTVTALAQTGVTWTKLLEVTQLGGNVAISSVWKGVVGSGAGTAVTVTLSGSANDCLAGAVEFSGTINVDAWTGLAGTSTSITGGIQLTGWEGGGTYVGWIYTRGAVPGIIPSSKWTIFTGYTTTAYGNAGLWYHHGSNGAMLVPSGMTDNTNLFLVHLGA